MSALTSQQPFDEDDNCAFCYEQFGSDGLEWVEYSCGRWVHEECIKEILTDDDRKERKKWLIIDLNIWAILGRGGR